MRASRHIHSWLWRTVAFLALLLTLLTGCGLPFPFPQPTPDPKLPDAQQIFRPLEIGPNAGDLATLDPALINLRVGYQAAQLIFPQLVTLDEQGQPIDWAAASHEVSADGLTYTFHLRKGMAWSDGTPIDATSFVYSINRTLDPCISSEIAYDLFPIKGAQAFNEGACPAESVKSATTLMGSSLLIPEPLTLQIKLERPAGYFLNALTAPASWAVPKALVERYTAFVKNGVVPHIESTWTNHLADNGGFGGNLYRVTAWYQAGYLTLERNERFWGRKPILRQIDWRFYRSVDAAWTDFKAGAGDTSPVPLSDASGQSSGELAVARALKSATVQQADLLTLSYLPVTWTRAPFDDVRVRQAFSLAIDRQAIAHGLHQDTVRPSVHLAPQGIARYSSALVDAAGRTGAKAFIPDLETARRLSNAYANEHCGGSYVQCPGIEFFAQFSPPIRGRESELVLQQWQQAFPGWPMKFVGHGEQRKASTPQIFGPVNMTADYPDAQAFLGQHWTAQALYTQSGVSIPQVDALCAQADGMSDQAARIPLYRQAEQLLITQAAAIPLYQYSDFHVVRTHVAGWRLAPTGQTPLSVWQSAYIRR